MDNSIRDKIDKLLDTIKDEGILTQVMEDVAFYSSKKDVVDYLNEDQLKELDTAIKEADNNEVIRWSDFKKELDEWKKRS